MRTAPKGFALWTPTGAFAPDPEMLRISTSPAGGTKDLGALILVISVPPSLPDFWQAGQHSRNNYRAPNPASRPQARRRCEASRGPGRKPRQESRGQRPLAPPAQGT